MSDKPDLAPVYVMTYDHLGIILWQLEALERVLDQELERLATYPAFKIGWDHEAYTYDHLAEHAPKLLERMQEALARFPGRMGVGTCTYGQPLSQFVCGESNVRQLTMALDTVEERLGVLPSVYVMSEHAMHAQIPQLLAGCGFKGAILRTHFMMYGYNPTIEAPVVWWVGLDGSQMPAVPTYPGQESPAMRSHAQPFGAVTLDNRILTDYPRYPDNLEAFRRRFGARIRPLVASRADDPRQTEEVIAVHEGDPAYTWVLAEEIFDYLPQPRVTLRTDPNDFGVRMPWGFCGNWIWNQSRRAETSVLTAERLAAFAHAAGGPDREDDLRAAWKKLLVGQHHDIQIVGLEDDAHTYLDASLAQSTRIIDACMADLGPRIGSEGGTRQVVFNPVPWERTDWVEMAGGGRLLTVPGLGFRSFPSSATGGQGGEIDWDPDTRRLRTACWDLTLGEHGGIVDLCDRKTGRRLLARGRPSGTLVGLIDGESCQSQGTIEVRIERERAVVREKGTVGPIPYQVEWSFYGALPRIDWYCELEAHGEKIGRPSDDPTDPYSGFEHEHKLRLRFYPQVRADATGARDLPFAVAETGHRYVEGLYWTALADAEGGLALSNRGLMGSVRESDGAFSVPVAFSMHYVWDTWDGLVTEDAAGCGPHFMQGTYRYELRVLPFVGDWHGADLQRRAIEYNMPCVTAQVAGREEPLGQTWQPCQVEGEGAILSALYTRQGRTYARFYEYRGVQAVVSVNWLGRPIDLVEVDLHGRPMGALGRTLLLGPWQVRTVALCVPQA